MKAGTINTGALEACSGLRNRHLAWSIADTQVFEVQWQGL